MRQRDVTSRRPGRPKTKFYVTLMARIPIHLASQVRSYALEHQLSISEVIRTGLLCILTTQHNHIPLIPIPEVADIPREEVCTNAPHAASASLLEIVVPEYGYLGTLCSGKHEFEGTGRTLRTKAKGICRLCANATRRTRYKRYKMLYTLAKA